MKRILYFVSIFAVCIGIANAAVRDENATNRTTMNTPTTSQNQNIVSRSATTTTRNVSGRNTTATPRAGTTATASTPVRDSGNTVARTTTARTVTQTATTTTRDTGSISRAASMVRNIATAPTTTASRTAGSPVISRAAIDTVSEVVTSTRTGAEYEQCKSAYFNCMDQFCELKNDDYRRCSCSNRVFDLTEDRGTLQDASEQLTVFTENLDVVGMTAEQATAMKTATEGENALTSDTTASKQLLQAIMNSIRGDDVSVGGKYSDLNSITIAFDTVNAFGTADTGQIIASYNGRNLYDAVYPQCRAAVRSDCTDEQLQRAVTAYLMAIEQDCNTVESALDSRRSEMKAAIRESSAMLDLARIENRQNHNSDDMATCITNVEQAILSEEVCGSNYHKCLDNGEFIDVTTGTPIAGVENFYELGNLLKFADGIVASEQKLSKVVANRSFVNNFETRVYKFAEPALDKCTEIADEVWAEYLDKALLDIYYAQQSKVKEIKQGCFDFVSACYMNSDTGLTMAMAELTGDDAVILQPDKVTLTNEMCRDYIESCNMMFYDQTGGENIVTDYVNNRQDTDTLTACRAVVQQCFDEFGGSNYENFYYPYSGLFKTGRALDWFTLYKYEDSSTPDMENPVSKCAQQLKSVESCSSPEIMETAFGGFDVITASKGRYNDEPVFYYDANGEYNYNTNTPGKHPKYGLLETSLTQITDVAQPVALLQHHVPRPTGVATEVYNQIVDILTTQCMNLQGRFLELQFIKTGLYYEDKLCVADFEGSREYGDLIGPYAIGVELLYTEPVSGIVSVASYGENMCPRDYDINIDTQSWGACLCWENGGRRSKYGKSPRCIAAIPLNNGNNINDISCSDVIGPELFEQTLPNSPEPGINAWCTQTPTENNQVCPLGGVEENGKCFLNGTEVENLPKGLL